MPSFDPNIMLGILQGQQSGQAFPTSVPGLPNQVLPKLQERIGAMSPERLGTLTTGFQNFAPTWQQGQQWGRNDILGPQQPVGDARGFGGFGGMCGHRSGFGGRNDFGGGMGNTGGGLRGGGGK